MHWVAIWQWLVANGLFRDVLATSIGLGAAKLMTMRPVQQHRQNQAQIADLLNTRTPGGLSDVVKAVKKREAGEPEDPTPDADDGDDESGEEEEERRKRRHGASSGHSSQEGRAGHHGDSSPPPDHDKPAPDPSSLLTHFRPGHGR